MNFAVIETGGKQYVVQAGMTVRIPRVVAEEGSVLSFDKVLLRAAEEGVAVGKPYLAGVRVSGKVMHQGREKKKIVFRYHAKTRLRKMKGHRQPFTAVEIASF